MKTPGTETPRGGAARAASATGMHVSSDREASIPCGEFDIRIGSDGTWFYHGSPITRKPLIKLFASVLRREADGAYWLVTPAERGRIVVDDAPFVAVELAVAGEGHDQQLIFRTNIDEIVTAGPDHHIHVTTDVGNGAPRPYLALRDGLEALIARPVFYQLVELGVEEKHSGGMTEYGVWSGGRFFALGCADGDR